MSRRKMLFLAVVISAGLSFGFADQKALASEPEVGVAETNAEDLTDSVGEVISVCSEEDSDTDEGTLLYSDDDGALYQTADGAFYYVYASTSVQATEKLVEIPSGDYVGIYYFGDDGYAVTDVLVTVDESTYYFGSDAKAVTDILMTVDEFMYYFGSDAKAVTDTLLTVDESTYYFGSDGKAVTDAFQTVDGSTYYFGTDGVMYTGTGLKTIGDSKYYFVDGVVQTGWQDINGSTYYFKKTSSDTANKGTMLTGLKKIGEYKYYFGTNGKLKTGWQDIDGSTYYFKKSASDTLRKGTMLTGLKKIGDYKYYFGTNGKLKTGWQDIDGSTYYFKKAATKTAHEGSMLTGLKKIGDDTYYFGTNGKLKTGWQTIDGNKYYFKKSKSDTQRKGAMLTGLKKIGDYKYYFNSSGVMQKNKIVGSKSKGYYYVDSSGKVVTTKSIQLAVEFVKAHTDSSMTKSEKLKACYNYLWKNYTYKRYYETPTASDMNTYAQQMFTNKKGNCYRYAASFACIAKVLGYESRVAVGKISSASGGMTAHGWTEVKVNGTWYICDANMQMNHPSINSYMRTESTYAYRHSCSARYTLSLSGGKAVWK